MPELPPDPDASDERPGRRPLHVRWSAIVLVFVGGAVGTAARYGLAVAAPTEAGRWPTGTFLANVLGAFVLGVLLEALARAGSDDGGRQHLRLLAGTGFCGGLTTYSTFAVEADLLVRSHDTDLAIGYLAASVVAGLVATTLGIVLAIRRSRA